MKKILIIVLTFLLSVVSFTNFATENFKATVSEKSLINGIKREKEYTVEYTANKLVIKIIKPNLNKGETYTYTKEYKEIYYPKLNQTNKQELDETEVSLFNILENIRNKKNSKEYIYENGNILKIKEQGYTIEFLKYKDKKPTLIKYSDGDNEIEYEFKYE